MSATSLAMGIGKWEGGRVEGRSFSVITLREEVVCLGGFGQGPAERKRTISAVISSKELV